MVSPTYDWRVCCLKAHHLDVVTILGLSEIVIQHPLDSLGTGRVAKRCWFVHATYDVCMQRVVRP